MLEAVCELGVCRSVPLDERLATYRGRAWWLPLRGDLRRQMDWYQFFTMVGKAEHEHIPYDIGGLFGFMLRDIPILGAHVAQEENHQAMFCSGLDTALLRASGVLRGVNWSKVTPQQIARFNTV